MLSANRRNIAWAMGLGFVAMAIAALAFLQTRPSPPAAAVGELCGADEPGWSGIVDASSGSASSSGFLCNYRVDRSDVTLSDGSKRNLGKSGVAVTIEYYCTPTEGRERWLTVAGPSAELHRKWETYHDDQSGVLITEEGPQAKNPDNPQAEGVFSNFFTDSQGNPTPFGLQEKEWRLLNEQVFATIVVLTNERGKVDETERFGVEQGEIVARTIADRSRSSAGCNVPAVATGPSATSTGGNLPVAVAIGLGGIAIVTIGGYTVWKRRKGAPGRVAPRVAAGVPPQCQGIAIRYDDAVQVLTTLREAEQDLGARLERAEMIHKNNLIKARMVVNIEIISAIGGSATDLALALRPAALRRAGPTALGQKDTWKPPGSISARWAERIRAAEVAAREAWTKFQALREEAAQLLSPVEERLRELPIVKNAKQMWEFHMNRLGEMIADLPKANQLRTELSQLDAAAETASSEMKAIQSAMRQAEAELSSAETAVNMQKNALPPNYNLAQQELREAEEKMAQLAAQGVEDTLRLGRAQQTLENAQGRFAAVSRAAQDVTAKLPELERAAADKKSALEALRKQLDGPGERYTKAVQQRQRVNNQLLTGLNDLTSADVDSQARIAAQAQSEYDAAQSQAREQLSRDLQKKRQESNAAEVQAASAQGLLDDMRGEAEAETLRSASQPPTKGGIMSAIGTAIAWASAPIRYPLTIASEIIFGVGQSPQEIMEILLQGRTNIQLLRSHLGAVNRAIYDQQRLVQQLKAQLEACLKVAAAAPTAVASPAPPAGAKAA